MLTGPRSIFYYLSPWKELHHYLYQHGYQVRVFPSSDLKIRGSQLQESHVICDAVTYYQLRPELKASTITILSEQTISQLPQNTFQILMDYRAVSVPYALHRAYLRLKGLNTPSAAEVALSPPQEIYDRILDHCVDLAELDFSDFDDLDLDTES